MLSPGERNGIKVAVAEASRSVAGHKVLAGDSRLVLNGAEAAHARVSEYANPACANRYVPLDIAVEFDRVLMAHGLEPLNVANAAALLGLRLAKRPASPTRRAVKAEYCIFARESGEAIAAAGRVVDDPQASVREIDAAVAELDGAVSAALDMRDLLAARRARLAGDEP